MIDRQKLLVLAEDVSPEVRAKHLAFLEKVTAFMAGLQRDSLEPIQVPPTLKQVKKLRAEAKGIGFPHPPKKDSGVRYHLAVIDDTLSSMFFALKSVSKYKEQIEASLVRLGQSVQKAKPWIEKSEPSASGGSTP